MSDGIWNATGGICEDDDDIDFFCEVFDEEIEEDCEDE